MPKVIHAAFAVLLASSLSAIFGVQASANELTKVTCLSPTAEVATGKDIGDLAARFTVVCTGGSTAGNITYFAFKIADNPTVAQLLAAQLSSNRKSVKILSDLNDTSGSAWGCGGANCRIIAYLYGE